MTEERDFKQISEVLARAKLDKGELKPVAQCVYFTSGDLYDNNYKLLELDPVLENEITQGNTLYIKGDDTEEVTICTTTKTFHVTEAETSNCLLLVNNLLFSGDISCDGEFSAHKLEVKRMSYKYLEPTISRPKLKKLETLLEDTMYRGPEFESEVDKSKLLTLEELKDKIQASDAELEEALTTLDVVTIDDKVRLLHYEYHFRAFSYMLKLIDENSWPLDQVDFMETVEALDDIVPREVVSGIFDKYAEESKVIDCLPLYRYNETLVCKFFAKVLLHGAGKFKLNEFMQAWKESVPEGMHTNEEMLHGISIIDRQSKPNVIWEFDEKNLPENIIQRFQVLFNAKEKWSVPEIAPYIQRLASEKLDVNTLLAKYARASTIDGVKYYSSKHGK